MTIRDPHLHDTDAERTMPTAATTAPDHIVGQHGMVADHSPEAGKKVDASSSAMLPCPFCGGAASQHWQSYTDPDSGGGTSIAYVRCSACGIEGRRAHKTMRESPEANRAEAIAYWNERVQPSIPAPAGGDAVAFLTRLVVHGGAIVSSAACSEMEMADARARGDWYVDPDGMGYVLRFKAWREWAERAITNPTPQIGDPVARTAQAEVDRRAIAKLPLLGATETAGGDAGDPPGAEAHFRRAEQAMHLMAKTGGGTYSGAMQDIINRQDEKIAALTADRDRLAAEVERLERSQRIGGRAITDLGVKLEATEQDRNSAVRERDEAQELIHYAEQAQAAHQAERDAALSRAADAESKLAKAEEEIQTSAKHRILLDESFCQQIAEAEAISARRGELLREALHFLSDGNPIGERFRLVSRIDADLAGTAPAMPAKIDFPLCDGVYPSATANGTSNPPVSKEMP